MQTPAELASKLPANLGSRKILSTRRGTIGVASLAAVAALVVLLVFMNNYRQSVPSATTVKALVAGRVIDKGTPGDVVAGSNLFDVQSVREDQLVGGAFTDPGALRGQVATTDIYKGQQLTSADFAPGADPITSELAGTDRAISVPLDAAHGNIALPYLIPCALHCSSVSPAHATSGSVYATDGIWRASKNDLWPAATSAATCASCTALCASIGWPTMSPIAKMCGTLVRIWLSTGMKPRSLTATPALSAPIFLPFGARPTLIRTAS